MTRLRVDYVAEVDEQALEHAMATQQTGVLYHQARVSWRAAGLPGETTRVSLKTPLQEVREALVEVLERPCRLTPLIVSSSLVDCTHPCDVLWLALVQSRAISVNKFPISRPDFLGVAWNPARLRSVVHAALVSASPGTIGSVDLRRGRIQ